MIIKKFFGASAIALCATVMTLGCSKAASALTFQFSFESESSPTTVSGTVTGLITGLVDNMSDQQAATIVITSFPDGLSGTPNVGLIVTDWERQSVNSFDVFNGEITGASFLAEDRTSSDQDVFCLNGFGCFTSSPLYFDALSFDIGGSTKSAATGGSISPNVATYQLVNSVLPVPLPAGFGLLAGAIGFLGFRAQKASFVT